MRLDKIEARDAGDGRFWLVLHEPGCVPERKGPWPDHLFRATLREFLAARPTAYVTVLTVDDGEPHVQHGPEALQMADARSMSVGSRHNAQTRAAHAPRHAALAAQALPVVWRMARAGKNITLFPADPTSGNAVISPEDPEAGCYWTLIGQGPDEQQNALGELIRGFLNTGEEPA